MKRENRTYTRDFEPETLRLYETSGKGASQVEHELGISRGCIYRWKKANMPFLVMVGSRRSKYK